MQHERPEIGRSFVVRSRDLYLIHTSKWNHIGLGTEMVFHLPPLSLPGRMVYT